VKDEITNLVTVVQAAKALGISRYAVYKAIDEGRLEAVEVLGKLGIPRRALKKYHPNKAKIRAGQARAQKL
jgi:excisionase family DNA binding protein